LTTGSFSFANDPSDEDLVTLAQSGQAEAWPDLYARFVPWIKKLASRLAPDLPRDLLDDIAQEVMSTVARPGVMFDQSRGRAKSYIKGLTRNAIKKVRSHYGKRLPAKRDAVQKAPSTPDRAVVTFSLDAPFGEAGNTIGDTLQAPDPIEEAVDRIATTQALTAARCSAPAEVTEALILIYEGDISFSAVAAKLGVNRITLSRHIRRWAATERLEVAPR